MKQILLAIDGSPHALEATRLLAQRFGNHPFTVIVLTVVEPCYADVNDSSPDWLVDQKQSENHAAADAYRRVRQLFRGTKSQISHEIREGEFGPTLVKAAKEADVDLVVVGARGRSAVSRILLGSVSDYVATHAPCSVLVVRPAKSSDRNRRFGVAIGYDDSEPARMALLEYCEFNWSANTEVNVLSASEYIEGFSRRSKANLAAADSTIAAVHRAVDQVQTITPNAHARFIECEHVGEGIVGLLERLETDLVIVGEAQQGWIGRIFMGGVSRFLLRHAPCSVWVARTRMAKESQSR